ncbi:MAG: DEAD/DEAH box helicase, partial [Bdellovibrionales bacterium]|nr:DEAD/DEAH box helicase [Bdellovibrionales bacterium]
MRMKAPILQAARSASCSNFHHTISGVDRAALPWLIAQLHDPEEKPLLFIANTDEEAESISSDLRLFLGSVLFLPSWEFSPYRKIAPSITCRHLRLHALGTLLHPAARSMGLVCVSSWLALSQCAPAQDLFLASPVLRRGTRLSPDELASRLLSLGYLSVHTVEDRGTFSRRGGVFDLFIPGSTHPLRLDYFDDEIDSLRPFDPASQASLRGEAVEQAVVWPNRDFLCDPENLSKARQRIRDWSDSVSLPRKSREQILETLAAGIATEELDYLLPLMDDTARPALDLLEGRVRLMAWEPRSGLDRLVETLSGFTRHFEEARKESLVCVPPASLFLSPEDWDRRISCVLEARVLRVEGDGKTANGTHLDTRPTPSLHATERPRERKRSVNVDHLVRYLGECRESGLQVTILCRSEAQLERIEFLLAQRRIKFARHPSGAPLDQPPDPWTVRLAFGELSHGFQERAQGHVFLPDHGIFGTPPPSGEAPRTPGAEVTPSLDLQEGDLVVHPEHGVGKYCGIVSLTASGVTGEFVLLEYGGQDKLYLPVYRLNLIQRWVGGGGPRPSLDKLGSQHFQKAKERAREAARDIAADLIKVHAERRLKKGFRFSDPDELYREFEGNFPYDETPDQLRAIEDTIRDMCSDHPMDRLICGDVGFGKTEVAIRAAFKACQDGKQVAILVPTTVLAEQHLSTFSRRLKDQALTVRGLSRFRPKAEQAETTAGLREGRVDIVIGTHRILSGDVEFSDLGLIIIDEEQRFGVEHKERLKKIRATVDVLTLTATPIPRTLHMSLMGLRDMCSDHPMDRLICGDVGFG